MWYFNNSCYKVAEMQISLMHDVFYTKAEVTHSWYGLCIRIISSLGTVTVLLLFHLQGDRKDGYNRVDVAVTYVLLVGAIILEITSALRAMLSSWTFALLYQRAEERNVWHLLAFIVGSLRRLVHAADWWRYWSGSMGQHNLLQLCARSWASKSSKIARWMGLEDPWNTMIYSSSIPVPACIKQLVVEQVLKSEGTLESTPEHIHNSRGREALEKRGLYENLAWSIDIGLDESILVWHIATDLYLYWYKEKAKGDPELLAHAGVMKTVEALSNYMLFLLVSRPYMLPPPASRNAYVHVCHFLSFLEHGTPEDLANLLRRSGNELNTRSNTEANDITLTGISGDSSRYKKILDRGSQLGAKLVDDKLQDSGTAGILELITRVWVEMLCYVGYRCSAYSHAKQLSNGSELITVAALLMEHIRRQTPEP
ncbi:hypothetical protein SEVIR_7G040700v4 [Setaria viridis]|uniref:DUF4220 domain-containing protein n=1 Tax=Setaria viridis TaxID=4556 RepID=A0A4U6TKJ3_SETVI|nr:hypothetical protein SEVIR_7G040700v2 [Setaria viridis]